MKNIVVWSGGFDSSFMIVELINTGKIKDECNLVCFMNTLVGENKCRREEESRKKLYEKFKDAYPEIKFSLVKLITGVHVVEGMEKSPSELGLNQPILWLSSLLPYLESDSVIYFGYLAEDDATGYCFLNQKIIDDFLLYRDSKNITVEYPLRNYHKYDVMYLMFNRQNEHPIYDAILKYATTCETSFEIDWCGVCKPCRHMMMSIIECILDASKDKSTCMNNAHVFLKEKFGQDMLDFDLERISNLLKGDNQNYDKTEYEI